jgi:hypothetical protein
MPHHDNNIIRGGIAMEMQAVVALVIGTVVVLFVPALVWSAVIAGLYQIIRDRVRESRKVVARKTSVSTR